MRRLILLFLASCSSTPDMGDGSPGTDSGSSAEASDDAAMTDGAMSGMDSGAPQQAAQEFDDLSSWSAP